MRIDRNLIRKLEQGKLDKQELENEELVDYAWERRETLKKDPRLFFVLEKGSKGIETSKIERKYDAEFVEGQTKRGKHFCLLQFQKESQNPPLLPSI